MGLPHFHKMQHAFVFLMKCFFFWSMKNAFPYFLFECKPHVCCPKQNKRLDTTLRNMNHGSTVYQVKREKPNCRRTFPTCTKKSTVATKKSKSQYVLHQILQTTILSTTHSPQHFSIGVILASLAKTKLKGLMTKNDFIIYHILGCGEAMGSRTEQIHGDGWLSHRGTTGTRNSQWLWKTGLPWYVKLKCCSDTCSRKMDKPH